MLLKCLARIVYFKLKYNNNILKPYVITGYKNIFFGKNSIIKEFASLRAYKDNTYGKIYIGDNTFINTSSQILAGSGDVIIGKNVIAGSKLTLLGGGDIFIGDNVLISHNVVISSSTHDFSDNTILLSQTADIFSKIHIADNVFIGANTTILMGSRIEKGAIIGAGSVITENTHIGKNEIWAGNPAKKIKPRVSLETQIEEEIVKYLETYPFHNIFLLYKKDIAGSEIGGTCSDRTPHFQKILINKFPAIDVKLHIASINNKKTHTILRIEISKKIYFCDVGMGFPITKLIPCDKAINFKAYGIDFKSIIKEEEIVFYINEHNINGEKELMRIDMRLQNQTKVRSNIANRFKYTKNLPLGKYLRYYFINNGVFYKIEE
jgi:acetyltransferase-like isoleucine patch superfamily enzyme